MDQDSSNGVAYCGLNCQLCGEETGCPGCRTGDNCGRAAVCLHRRCCRDKGLAGCWECPEPCGQDMHAPDRDVRLRAFVRYIRENGVEKFLRRMRENQLAGVAYHGENSLFGDYDRLGSEEAVLRLLDHGPDR